MKLIDRFKKDSVKFWKYCFKVSKKAGYSIIREFEKGLGIEDNGQKEPQKIPHQDKKGTLYAGFFKQKLYFEYGDWQHKLLIGKHGTGKNTIAENITINTPHGVAFIDDAKGSSIDKILRALPKEKLEKTVVLDHSKKKEPLALGAVKGVDSIFENDMAVGQWEDFFISNFEIGDLFRTRRLIRYAMKATFAVGGMTVLDAVKFVENEDFRNYCLSKIANKREYRDVLEYWNNFDEMSDNQKQSHSAAFLNRTGNIMGDTILRTTLGQTPKEELNYEKWVNEGYTVLIKVPEKDLPTEVVRIISALHVLNLWRACLNRGDVFDDPSKQFTVICDEPQGWLGRNTRVLDNIFSKARAYRMNIICLIQSTAQIKGESSKLLKVMLHNQPDILALSYADINGLKSFDWESLRKYQFLARVQGEKFIAKGLKPVEPVRSKEAVKRIYGLFRQRFNRHYRDVLNRIDRRIRRWDRANIKEEKKSRRSQGTGSKKMSNTESQKTTEDCSDSSIVTNW